MALGDNYATRSELQARIGLSGPTADEQARLDNALATASREIEEFCNRQFNAASSASMREYRATARGCLVDDFYEDPTTVVVVEYVKGGSDITRTLTTSDYKLAPLNSQRLGHAVAAPKWRLLNKSALDWPQDFDCGVLQVTAKWGWAAVPAPIKEATLIMAEEYFKLKEAPFGVANWGEFGPMRVTDNKRAYSILRKYSRGKVKVG